MKLVKTAESCLFPCLWQMLSDADAAKFSFKCFSLRSNLIRPAPSSSLCNHYIVCSDERGLISDEYAPHASTYTLFVYSALRKFLVSVVWQRRIQLLGFFYFHSYLLFCYLFCPPCVLFTESLRSVLWSGTTKTFGPDSSASAVPRWCDRFSQG